MSGVRKSDVEVNIESAMALLNGGAGWRGQLERLIGG